MDPAPMLTAILHPYLAKLLREFTIVNMKQQLRLARRKLSASMLIQRAIMVIMIVSTSSRNAGASLFEQGKQELLSQLVDDINSVVVMGTHSYTSECAL